MNDGDCSRPQGPARARPTDGDFPHARRRSVLACQASTTCCCCCCFTFLIGAMGTGAGAAAGLLQALWAADDESKRSDQSGRDACEIVSAWLVGLGVAGLVAGAAVGYGLDWGCGVHLFHDPLIRWSGILGVLCGLTGVIWFNRAYGGRFIRAVVQIATWGVCGTMVGAAGGYGFDVLFDGEVHGILIGAFGSGAGLTVGWSYVSRSRWPSAEAIEELLRAWDRFLIPVITGVVLGLTLGLASGSGVDAICGVQRFGHPGIVLGATLGAGAGMMIALRADHRQEWLATRSLIQLITHTACGILLGAASGFGIDLLFDLAWW